MLFKLDRPVKVINGESDLNLDDFRWPRFQEYQAIVRNAEVRRVVCDRFIKLCQCMTPELETELAAMPYRDFLDTDYWAYLRDYIVMAKGMRCEVCHYHVGVQQDGLQLHHISYDHRGSEWRHMEDLKVLCSACHAKERR